MPKPFQYVAKRDLDGSWSVRQVATKRPAVVRRTPLVGLTESAAAESARKLNSGALRERQPFAWEPKGGMNCWPPQGDEGTGPRAGEVMMDKLHLGVEIRDFDLERMGFSFSVLDEANSRQLSEGYLRMTLAELNTFLKALKAAAESIEVSTTDHGPGKTRAAMLLGRSAPAPSA